MPSFASFAKWSMLRLRTVVARISARRRVFWMSDRMEVGC